MRSMVTLPENLPDYVPEHRDEKRRIAERGVGTRRVCASLHLDFEHDASSNRTLLASSKQEPPLRVVRAFSNDQGSALVHLHNVSGGVLGGDELALHVNVRAGAQVQITTTGATRLYRPKENALAASQLNEVDVGENALLEYVPDPVIPYAGARFRQRTSIKMAAGSSLFWWEIVSPGREARNEIFEYESLEFGSNIWAMEKPVLVERVLLEPANRRVASSARLGRYHTWASFYICQVGLNAAAWIAAEEELRVLLRGLGERQLALWGVSTLPAHGLVVRCVAERGRDVMTGLHAVWDAAKMHLHGRPAVPPRKVN
jgi:urease accessory protein